MKNKVLFLFSVILVLSLLIMGGCRSEEEEETDVFGPSTIPVNTEPLTQSSTTPVTPTSQVVSKWDMTGEWTLKVFTSSGAIYYHDYSITQTESILTGTGDSSDGHSETVVGSNLMTATGPISMVIDYENEYTYILEGTIDQDGKLSGEWYDNYTPPHEGTFETLSGAAKPLP